MTGLLVVVGFVFLAGFMAARAWVARRQFYRRNRSGVLIFKNYRSFVLFDMANNAITALGRVSAVIGVGCLISWYILQQSPPGQANAPGSVQQVQRAG